jgi:hypothetical protein
MIGMGCKAAYSIASPTSWVEVENIVDLGLPVQTADRVDKTVHLPGSRLKRAEPGLENVADPFLTLLQDLSDAPQKVLRTLKADRTKVWWRFEVPTEDDCSLFVGFEFEARVANFEPAVPKDGEQTTKYTLMFDGEEIAEDLAAAASEIS